LDGATAKWFSVKNTVIKKRRGLVPMLREGILNMHVFRTLTEVRELTEDWVREYNEERPHDSLNDLTPWEYLAQHELRENSNLGRH